MKVSRSKTEYLCINGRNNDKTVKMEDAKVPRVKEFKYFKYLGFRCTKVVVVRGRLRREYRQDRTDGEKYRE